jgi:hypothetical protein
MLKWTGYRLLRSAWPALGISAAQAADEPADLVAAAQKTFADMQNDPDMTWFRDNLKNARAVLIAPEIAKPALCSAVQAGAA